MNNTLGRSISDGNKFKPIIHTKEVWLRYLLVSSRHWGLYSTCVTWIPLLVPSDNTVSIFDVFNITKCDLMYHVLIDSKGVSQSTIVNMWLKHIHAPVAVCDICPKFSLNWNRTNYHPSIKTHFICKIVLTICTEHKNELNNNRIIGYGEIRFCKI